MKLHTQNTESYSSQQIVQQEFKIQASAKAFKILSSNLYKNKIRAIIRELSANALDAHIAAGNPERQFKVHLPSSLDPMFWIRDFGIGLSKEQVFNLYTTYFESTKADSNDYVGALGLGSKSPFSYVDSFTVTSFYNGVKSIYDMSLKGGVPNVAVLYEGETEEENGLMISVSVNTNDISRFHSEARYVYKTFSIKPDFSGMACSVDLHNVVDHKGYFMANDSDYSNTVYALMGNIAYPILPSLWDKTILQTVVSRSAVFIRFELGELDITPSREELSYDQDTEKAIEGRLNNLNKRLIDDILVEYKDIKCPREAYAQIKSKHSFLYQHIAKEVVIDGKNITQWHSHFDQDFKTSSSAIKFRKIRTWKDGSMNSHWYGKSYYSSEKLAAIHRRSITIVLNDNNKAPLQTIRGLVAMGKIGEGDDVYLMCTHKYNQAELKAVANLRSLWGKDATIYVNSEIGPEARKALPKEPTKKRSKPCNASKLEYSNGVVREVPTTYYVEDIDAYTGHYAFKFYDELVDEDENRVVNMNTVEEFMVAHDIDEVLLVRKQHWKRMKKNTVAKEISSTIVESLDNFSGRMVALKYGNKPPVSLPSWIRKLQGVEPEIVVDFLPKAQYNVQHKLYDFISIVRNDSSIIKRASKDAKKQLDMFWGTRRAIELNMTERTVNLSNKYDFIEFVVERTYGGDTLRRYLPYIKLAKSFTDSQK